LRYSPVGPLIVPRSTSGVSFEIVGQPAAGVTSVGVGGGGAGGGGGGGLVIVMFPPLPGEAISSAPPHAPSAAQAVRRGISRSSLARSMKSPLRRSRLDDNESTAARERAWPNGAES
jgi:hypothetical protein